MKTTHWALGAVAALALNGSIGSAQAAPSGVSAVLRAVAGEFSNVETVHRRRAWRHGHRHSRRYVRPYRYDGAPYYRYYDYGPSYYGLPYYAYGYPYGYGPGIDLFFGHHHHHHGHGHH
ncbi:MAG: hypothetical protein K2X43_12635 [Hyphomonadaceae bacterium]|nr:hypothetical protein [Hyphomonadaceae bacterium]